MKITAYGGYARHQDHVLACLIFSNVGGHIFTPINRCRGDPAEYNAMYLHHDEPIITSTDTNTCIFGDTPYARNNKVNIKRTEAEVAQYAFAA